MKNITNAENKTKRCNLEKVIEVLLLKPRKYPEKIIVENTSEALAAVIGSPEIELIPHPFDDYAVIVSPSLEASASMQNNRALRCPDGEIILGFNGSILIVGGTKENGLRSLTKKQTMRYYGEFYHPEVFMMVDDFMIVSKLPEELIVYDEFGIDEDESEDMI